MRFFILFSLAILVYADVPGCPNGLMSFNYSKLPVVFPSGGDLQTFPDFYNCQLQISVPLGYFAIFTLDVNSANPGKNAPVQVIDQTNQTENVFHSETEEFYLISKGGSINLSTGNSKTQFRVQINWKQYLRGLIFFNGPYWNSTILGTGRQIFDRKSQFVTSAPYNHYLTVLFLGNSAETDIQFVEQLYENTQQFTEIQTLVYNGNITRELTMEASGNGKSIVQTYSSHSIVEGILSIDGTEYLDVYPHEGLKNMSNSIIRYRASDSSSQLPQQFNGQPNSYVLTGGKAKITLSNVQSRLEETKDFGRSGFLESRYFGQPWMDQDFKFGLKAVNSTTPTVFKFEFGTVPLENQDTLHVTIYNGGVDQTISYYNKKPTNGSLEVIGDYCTVSYDTGIGGIHNGSLIRYTVTQPKLTIGLSGIFSFVFVALNVFAFH
ncbi:hypothetical protein B9Z55_026775 [Caenorhabditis nigoni]|uniref:Uncharacterized protein n=1 Tax=Caenorhabditis nigoni TaxID=1611254 RepID=A0A2G5SH86_9PELO|nr:hypothetical protein B9Z55_026775 [Caenorhabditis nigoni]